MKFWVPLVLYFTGARLTEISQLHVADVRTDPVPHVLLENLEDEDPVAAKKLKTDSSHRAVPLHHDLLEIGFLDYVDKVRKQESLHVFPKLPHQKEIGVGDLISRDFIARFRRFGERNPDSGLNTKSLVTHGLRHTFRSEALKLPDQMFVKIAMGHYVPGESIQTYGKEAYLMPDLLAEKVMDDLVLPKLELTSLKDQAQKWL